MSDIGLVALLFVCYFVIHGRHTWKEFIEPLTQRRQVKELMLDLDEVAQGKLR